MKNLNIKEKSKKEDPRDIFPEYTRNAYHVAAKRIRRAVRNSDILEERDERVVENWRASHRHILNAWQVTLRARGGSGDIVFAQRLKRRNTIYNKLLREPSMSLVKMHDIAGCRLIFKSLDEMVNYINNLHNSKKLKHKLKREYDYINFPHPQNSGYRGIHDEYMYCSRKASDRSDRWDGLYLEIQFRTIYQHAWATAVEVADMLTQRSIKFSQGDEKQKDFFRLTSEIIARVYEEQHSCYPEMSDSELADRFEQLESEINLLHRLRQIKISQGDPAWKNSVILHFEKKQPIKSIKPKLNITTYRSFSEANQHYFKLEKNFPDDDIVLVRTNDNSIGKSIKDAFRNYFSDAKDFIGYVESGIKCLRKEITITPQILTKKLNATGIQGELELW